MTRKIAVMSNCQTGAIQAGLRAMFSGDEIHGTMWLGFPPDDLATALDGASVLVTSLDRGRAGDLLVEYDATAELVIVPDLYFDGFHPDLTQVMRADGSEFLGAFGPYHSRIVVWDWAHGRDRDEIIAHFTPATFAALGYLDTWAPSLAVLAARFEGTDVDFASWYLPLVRGGAFMLTNNHPRLDALIGVTRQVALHLGADPDVVAYDWRRVIPDGLLATSVVWPLYPGVADRFDLPGAFVWRAADGEVVPLERFVDACLAHYASVDPADVDFSPLQADGRFAATLGDHANRTVRSA